MFKGRKRRGGFTLPEVLVTIAIVAVLAAAVVPTVVNQISKGDAGSVVADFNALNTGVTQFVADTRKYPALLADLNTEPASTADDLLAVDYGVAAVNRWKGPYLATTQTLTSGYDMGGFNIRVANALVAPAAGNGFHITLTLVPQAGGAFTPAQIASIDQLIDGGDGSVESVDCDPVTAASTAGRLTWTESAVCVISAVQYRLVPVGS